MLGLGQVRFPHPDAEFDLSPARRCEAVAVALEVTGDQREQVARLGERILPYRPVHPAVALAAVDGIAVGQQHGIANPVGAHPDAITAEHVRPVREEGDPAEAFGLALRAEQPARGIKPHQLAVLLRHDRDFGLDRRRPPTDRDDQLPPFEARLHRLAVHPHGKQLQLLAIEPKRAVMLAVALHRQAGRDHRPRRVELEIERDRRDQPVGRTVILAPDGGRSGDGRTGIKHAR